MMAASFFDRLRNYYLDVAAVLRGEAKISSIFPNTTDIGMSREKVYLEFLKLHAPSKCNVYLGGFVFGDDGSESGQLDLIITTDTTPQFNFNNRDGLGKTFAPVEGTLGVASIKSMLNKNEIEDALLGISKIPSTSSLEGRIPFNFSIKNYEDWPYKIIYASDGISSDVLLSHINNFYLDNPAIPVCRRPNIIHVAGKYVIFRAVPQMSMWSGSRQKKESLKEGEFFVFITDSDLQGIFWVLNDLQEKASRSTHIFYSYGEIINRINKIPEIR